MGPGICISNQPLLSGGDAAGPWTTLSVTRPCRPTRWDTGELKYAPGQIRIARSFLTPMKKLKWHLQTLGVTGFLMVFIFSFFLLLLLSIKQKEEKPKKWKGRKCKESQNT